MTGEYLVCPECRGGAALQARPDALYCSSCAGAFPYLGGIPVLMPRVSERLSQWSHRLAEFQAETNDAVRQLLAQSVEEGLLPRTRARLTTVADGLRRHAERIGELFRVAGLAEVGSASGGGIETGSILSYYTLVHRDWGWEPDVDEVSPAVDALVAVLPANFQMGRTLVLGAGTARLAWELGNRIDGTAEILALDINPLPFLVTKRLMVGEVVSMFELPGHPRRSTFACTERHLRAPSAPPKGLQLIFADGLNPPVKDGSFDTVVTPWFVDQVPEDLADLPAMIRRVLRPGGVWLNQGPFVYDPVRTKPAHRYCADEFIQIVSGAGFTVSKATYLPQNHLASPVSAQGRSEWVLCMHATLNATERSAVAEPHWLSNSGVDLSIPELPGLAHYAPPHPSIAAVARLIDGANSAQSIATSLVVSGELSETGATEAVRACLRVIWRDLGRRSLGE
jgi:uncharacterized protein YbaR (Trm112 family)/SAM-dependent methyltransferase